MFALQRALRKVRPAWLHVGGPLARRRDALVLVLGGPHRGVRLRGGGSAVCDRPEHAVRQLDDAVRRGWRAGIVQRRKLPAAIHRIGLVSRLDSGPLRPGHAGADRALALPDPSVAGRPAKAPLRFADLREEWFLPRAAPPTARRWPASVRVRYGKYRRERLIELARRSRACVYLSDCDRGPLALAEILLAGCPAVGVPCGAPWIGSGQTGVQVQTLDFPRCPRRLTRLCNWTAKPSAPPHRSGSTRRRPCKPCCGR